MKESAGFNENGCTIGSHRRKYETFDKFSFYVAGISLVGLLSVITSITSDQLSVTRALAQTSFEQQSNISSIATRLEAVIGNQVRQQTTLGFVEKNQIKLQITVSHVEKKMSKICEKSGDC